MHLLRLIPLHTGYHGTVLPLDAVAQPYTHMLTPLQIFKVVAPTLAGQAMTELVFRLQVVNLSKTVSGGVSTIKYNKLNKQYCIFIFS